MDFLARPSRIATNLLRGMARLVQRSSALCLSEEEGEHISGED